MLRHRISEFEIEPTCEENEYLLEIIGFGTDMFGNSTIHRLLQSTVSSQMVGLSTSEGSGRPFGLRWTSKGMRK